MARRNTSKRSWPFGARHKDNTPLPMVVGIGLSALALLVVLGHSDATSSTHEKEAMQQMGFSFDVDVPVSGAHTTILKIDSATDGKPNTCVLFTEIDGTTQGWTALHLFPDRPLVGATYNTFDQGPHTLTYTLRCQNPGGRMLKGTDHYPKSITLTVRNTDIKENILHSTLQLRNDVPTYVPEDLKTNRQ